jgi:hypothetical protein
MDAAEWLGATVGAWLPRGIDIAILTTITAIATSVQTSLYVELRDWKDGPQTDRLKDVFA